MAFRSLVFILIVASSFVLVAGQTPDGRTGDPDKVVKTSGPGKTLRDIPFPNGVSLLFVIRELAKDLNLNVLFDPESRLDVRRATIELKSVTSAEALEYILLQEGLVFEEVGPKTFMVAIRNRVTGISQIGVSVALLPEQLAQYFGVEGGILINGVRPNSPASKAGLKAGDIIVEIDGVRVYGTLGAVRVIDDKKANDVVISFVRDRKSQTISLTPERGIK